VSVAVGFPLTVDDKVSLIRIHRIAEQQCYSLRVGILVWNFRFYTRNSKPENLHSRTLTWYHSNTSTVTVLDTLGLQHIRATKGCFCNVPFTDGRWQVQLHWPFIRGLRVDQGYSLRAGFCGLEFHVSCEKFLRTHHKNEWYMVYIVLVVAEKFRISGWSAIACEHTGYSHYTYFVWHR